MSVETETVRVKAPAKDAEKIVQLLSFDSWMSNKWLRHPEAVLVGTDEVGRGCLAGPVVAAAVQLPDLSPGSSLAKMLAELDDSKKLPASSREALSEILRAKCRYAIGEASVEEIDKINILQASFLAMRRALEQLALPDSSTILVDGNRKITGLTLRQILLVGGDGTSASIAAASVIAKVHRDKLMCRLHNDFPHYQWSSNKGYGSKDHRDALQEHGLSIWHRQSFCSKIVDAQLSLFET